MADKLNPTMTRFGKRKTDTGTYPSVQVAASERPLRCDNCGKTGNVKHAPKRRYLCVKCRELLED